MGRHGAEASAVFAAGGEDGDPTAKISTSPALWAELRYAARNEGIVHLEDLLLRRVRIGLLVDQGAMPLMDRIRKVVQPELGWTDEEWTKEEAAYREIWNRAYGSRF